jgi:hypothetical protein
VTLRREIARLRALAERLPAPAVAATDAGAHFDRTVRLLAMADTIEVERVLAAGEWPAGLPETVRRHYEAAAFLADRLGAEDAKAVADAAQAKGATSPWSGTELRGYPQPPVRASCWPAETDLPELALPADLLERVEAALNEYREETHKCEKL